MATSVDEFIEKFVIDNPYIKQDVVLDVMNNVRLGRKTHTPRWNQYLIGTQMITAFAFIQNSLSFGKIYFAGNSLKNTVKHFSGIDCENIPSINHQIRKFLREPTQEEAMLLRESARASNPNGFRSDVYRQAEDIVNMFVGGEAILSIAKKFACTEKVIYKVLSENCDVKSIMQQNIGSRKQQYSNKKKQAEIDRNDAIRVRNEIAEAKKILKLQKRNSKPPKISKPKKLNQTVNGKKLIIDSVKLDVKEVTFDSLYNVLSKKDHNPIYLKRYIRLILGCLHNNPLNRHRENYSEDHHIAPKSHDLFPEYFSFDDNPWNLAQLSGRQHFIAHWLLWKSYGGAQTFAFSAMCGGQKSKCQVGRYNRINSRTYEALKTENSKYISGIKLGKASYRDTNGNIEYCSTSDPRVLSGELTSLSAGRTFKRKHKSGKGSHAMISGKWKTFPIRKKSLYFLDIKIDVEYTQHDYVFLKYIDQGWSLRITPEYLSAKSRKINIAVFERMITNQISKNDYSKFEYLYDTEECVVLMGVRKTLTREYPGRYVVYASPRNFKHYEDLLTGNIHQLDPMIFPILDNFIQIRPSCVRNRK